METRLRGRDKKDAMAARAAAEFAAWASSASVELATAAA